MFGNLHHGRRRLWFVGLLTNNPLSLLLTAISNPLVVSCNLWTDDANKFIQSPSEALSGLFVTVTPPPPPLVNDSLATAIHLQKLRCFVKVYPEKTLIGRQLVVDGSV